MRRIPGCKNYYAYEDGRIYRRKDNSFKQMTEYRRAYSKYLYVYIYKNPKDKYSLPVHKLIASAYHKIKYNKYYIGHKDRNILNNKPGNLILIMKKQDSSINENKKFDEKNLRDIEALFKHCIGYDYECFDWKNYERIKKEKSMKYRKNWLKLFLISKNCYDLS